MITIDKCARSFRAGRFSYTWSRTVFSQTGINMESACRRAAADFGLPPADFEDGWRSAKRDAEVEAHLESEAANGN